MPKSKRYLAWLEQAKFDLEAAQLSFDNSFFEWAAYQSGQCVEKALKSVIVKGGERSPKIHKLSVLFGYCNSVNSEFRNTKFNFRHVESFTFISRYPFLIPGKEDSPHELISKSDAQQTIREASDVLEKIEAILQRNGSVEEIKLPTAITESQLEQRISEIHDILVREFNPEKIILFGSYSRKPLPKTLSTMDILIIAETKLTFVERIEKAREATRGDVPTIEPLVYTPEEFQIMTQVKGESFFEEALSEGKIIYEKSKSS